MKNHNSIFEYSFGTSNEPCQWKVWNFKCGPWLPLSSYSCRRRVLRKPVEPWWGKCPAQVGGWKTDKLTFETRGLEEQNAHLKIRKGQRYASCDQEMIIRSSWLENLQTRCAKCSEYYGDYVKYLAIIPFSFGLWTFLRPSGTFAGGLTASRYLYLERLFDPFRCPSWPWKEATANTKNH